LRGCGFPEAPGWYPGDTPERFFRIASLAAGGG
jgi:hypothetical protein